MIGQALALAILTFVGFFIVFSKLPVKVQNWIHKHGLFTEIGTLLGAYVLLGGTLTALFASAIVGLMVSAGLYIHQNKNDFSYLFDLADWLKGAAKKGQAELKKYGEEYRLKKEFKDEYKSNHTPGDSNEN
jgi:hypothetical protein